MDWTQPQEARQVWISFLNLSVQEEQFKATIWKCTHTSLKSIFLVFYLYLPIEVAQRDKMARGGGTHLLLVWPGFGFAELASHVHVGWVCCWFMCLLWGFFFGASGFPPSTKPTFQIPIQPASSGKEEPPSGMSFAEFPFIYLFYLIEIKRWGSKLNKN